VVIYKKMQRPFRCKIAKYCTNGLGGVPQDNRAFDKVRVKAFRIIHIN